MELVPPSGPSRKRPVRSTPAYFKPLVNVYQPELVPRSVEEMVDSEDAVRSVMALLPYLDLSALESKRSLVGGVAYDPRMLVGVWILALWDGERRSRRIERACKTDVRYMLLTGGLKPDHTTLCRFRREISEFLPELLAKTVEGALQAGLANLERACVDGTRIPAASSQWRKLLKEAEVADEADGVPKSEEKKDKGGKGKPRRPKAPSSDPDARTLKTRKGFIGGYNAQALTDVSSGLLLATDLSASNDDSVRLAPLLDTFLERHEDLPKELALDAGYDSPRNAEALDALDITGYVSCKDRKFDLALDEEERIVCPHGTVLDRIDYFTKKGELKERRSCECPQCGNRTISCPEGVNLTHWVKQRLRSRTDQAKEARIDRGSTAEWFFAQIKDKLGLTRFLLKGEKGAKTEFDMAGLAHNLRVLIAKAGIQGLIEALLAIFNALRACIRQLTSNCSAHGIHV